FCNYCGASMGDSPGPPMPPTPERFDRARQYSPEPRPAYSAAPSSYSDEVGEKIIFTLRPTLIFVAIWYMAAAFVVVATAAVMGALHQYVSTQVAVLVIAIVAAVVFTVPIYKHILRRREVYTLTNHKLEMRYGLVSKIVRNIPLWNIQDVTVTATVAQ